MMMLRVVDIAVVVVVIALRGIEWRSADDGTAGFDGSREHETGVESGFGNEVALLCRVKDMPKSQPLVDHDAHLMHHHEKAEQRAREDEHEYRPVDGISPSLGSPFVRRHGFQRRYRSPIGSC
jgi:hypothetical protein